MQIDICWHCYYVHLVTKIYNATACVHITPTRNPIPTMSLSSRFFLRAFCRFSSRFPCLVDVVVLLMIVGDHLVKVYSVSRRDVKRGASIKNSRI